MKKLKLIIFYFLSFTWGGLMSFIGLFAFIGAALWPSSKVGVFHGRLYVEIGENWGGLELGCFFLVNKGAGYHIKAHEAGHTVQNIIYGPLFPFIVAIPSAIRYWYREYRYRHNLPVHTQYDDIWFEGQATRWGKKLFVGE